MFSVLSINAQENKQSTQTQLSGQIVANDTKEAMFGANIVNLNEVIGSTTNDLGEFSIMTKVNDTIMVSYVGYQTIKLRVTQDLLKGNELEIVLYEKTEELKAATVNSHNLIGVLEIDIKQVPKDEYNRIHIDGLPQLYEIGAPKATSYRSPVDAVFHPVDFMYNMFGKKPKQLAKLKKMRKEDEMRAILADRFDRELLLEYLSMTPQELDVLLDDCKYSDQYVAKASDLQLLEALLECYENYKAIQQGSVARKNVIN